MWLPLSYAPSIGLFFEHPKDPHTLKAEQLLQGLEEPMLHKFENSEQVLATKVGRVIVSGRSIS